mmetsp:Transcript_32198/g.68141  ORF Transcript_32198/g.68141 Transcript_32198/m.68141 type:complete len:560 (+) Transcript_32198:16-1695(+)
MRPCEIQKTASQRNQANNDMMVLPHLLLSVWAFQSSLTAARGFASPMTNIERQRMSLVKNYERNDIGPVSLAMVQDGQSSPSTVDLCIVGGGISGLAAAITAAQNEKSTSILLLESDFAAGGRVRSDYTSDGYTLDRGFAVFIEEYPQSKSMLDYDALNLKQFLPGAKVKLLGRDQLATVADPLRRRRDVFRAIASPVGSPRDKVRLLPLFYGVMTKSIEELFDMEETDTLSCLKNKYNFSDEFISSFFAPFLEGIYLSPLEMQSSRMFHFVMKMFTVGVTSLPRGGMQAVADQLERKAKELGVGVQFGSRALSIQSGGDGNSCEDFSVEVDSNENGKQTVNAKSVIIATDFNVARNLLDSMGENEQKSVTKIPQRSVGCIYYGFQSPAPLTDPVLILNGEGSSHRNKKDFPINNVCFPSVVQSGYAPNGYELCSVSILQNALSEHDRDHTSLDMAVRKQLSTWFPDYTNDIMDGSKWVQKGIYTIPNAQPAHYGNEDGCANVHGGRDCSAFQGIRLPSGMFVCGDHMATSTFNGALESGVNAGNAAMTFITEPQTQEA